MSHAKPILSTRGAMRASSLGRRQVVTATAEDRAREFRRARRHSFAVSTLKVVLPLGALAVSGLYASLFVEMSGVGTAISQLPVPKILPEHLTMRNPRYEGFAKDGGSYVFTADSAAQSLSATNMVSLEAIKGRLTDAKDVQTSLAATRGTFDTKTNILELVEGIDISSTSGMKAKLDRATIQTKESIITSEVPVEVEMPSGRIQANRMTIRQKLKEISFVDAVVARVQPPKKAAEPAAANAASAVQSQSFGDPNQPVDITASRLDVNDAAKVATFSGTVRAVQGTSVLTSPEIKITYQGDAAGASPAPGQPANAGLSRMTASNPVVLTRGTSEQITSTSADFDAENDIAILSGTVVMASLPDRRASGDRLEFNSRANTVLLTGAAVSVTQGRNSIQGRRLFLDRARGVSDVSAPATAGLAAGRIKARLYQTGAAQTPVAKETVEKPPAGAPFGGGSFKTDPNAPIDIDADTLDIDDINSVATFRGTVLAKQADFSVKSAQLTAFYTGRAGLGGDPADAASEQTSAQISRVEAKGDVVIRSQDGQTATGDWAKFDIKNDKAVVGGSVVLTQGPNSVRGSRLVINLKTGESTVETGGGAGDVATGGVAAAAARAAGNRPSAIFFPKSKDKSTNSSTEAIEKAAKAARSGSSTSSWEAQTEP